MCLCLFAHMNPPTKKGNELGSPACLLLSTLASFQRLHFYYDKLQVFLFLMNSSQRNSLNFLFRSTTTCFLCIAGRNLSLESFSMLSLVNWRVADRRQRCHVLVVRILCMYTLNRRGCVKLQYSSEVLGPQAAQAPAVRWSSCAITVMAEL